jgi:hypothetical protein
MQVDAKLSRDPSLHKQTDLPSPLVQSPNAAPADPMEQTSRRQSRKVVRNIPLRLVIFFTATIALGMVMAVYAEEIWGGIAYALFYACMAAGLEDPKSMMYRTGDALCPIITEWFE